MFKTISILLLTACSFLFFYEHEKEEVELDPFTWGDPFEVVEPIGLIDQCVEDVSAEPSHPIVGDKKQMKIVGRLAQGIAKQKYKNGWPECGRWVTEKKAIDDLAIQYAFAIVRAAWEVSGDDFILNPWGLAGVIKNKSNFDRCALGLYPRRKAYELGILKRRKRCISHTEEEILKVVNHPKMKNLFSRSGYDIGSTQLLSRFYSNPNDFKQMMSLDYGVAEGAREMRHRGRIYRTPKPWAFWRGYNCGWYEDKIKRRMKKLGAVAREDF